MNKKILLSLTIGVLVSAVALYLVFRNIPLRELVSYLGTVNYWWVLPAVVVNIIGFWLRVVRWQLLLSPFKKAGYWSAHHPLMIGFMANCVLPGRVGELARPAIFYKREGVAFSKVLATVGAERLFDVVVLLLCFVMVLSTANISPSLNMTFGDYQLNKATLETIGMRTLQLCILLIAGIVLVSVRQTQAIIRKIILRLPQLFFFAPTGFREKIREKLCIKLIHIFDNVVAGLDLLKSPKKVTLCFVLSIIVWAVSGLSYYVMTFGCPGIDLSFLEVFAMMVILCFFISLPSAPGFWGLWEAGGVFGLLIFGVSATEARGYTLVNHVFQMLPIIVIGLISAVITGISITHVAYEAPTKGKLEEGESQAETSQITHSIASRE
ncbi:MAG: flippase-like domain-containing protein [Deltaproteobacteria bacterium]|nr:flippase-like domain-containing protein [Deltaproteobacteria bacterium]